MQKIVKSSWIEENVNIPTIYKENYQFNAKNSFVKVILRS